MLKWMTIRYKVKADRAAENEEYVRAVFEQIQREQPHGVSYATFKLEDGVSFMHVVALDADLESNPIVQLPAFKAFTAAIGDRCAEPPVTSAMQVVGSYGFPTE